MCIWHKMTHLTSNDAYDIKLHIWHQMAHLTSNHIKWRIWQQMTHMKSIYDIGQLPILVSKETSEPQQSHLLVWFWLKKSFKIKNLKKLLGIFFLYKFGKSFVFFDKDKKMCWIQNCSDLTIFFLLFNFVILQEYNNQPEFNQRKIVHLTNPDVRSHSKIVVLYRRLFLVQNGVFFN